jgi:hypothetical protein
MNCKTCDKKCEGEYCFAHKPKKPMKRTRIKQGGVKIAYRSAKRIAQEREYSKVRREFLNEFDGCQVSGCNNPSDQVHHKKGRIGALLTDVSEFLAVCASCHIEIENNPIWAKENGYSGNRTTN